MTLTSPANKFQTTLEEPAQEGLVTFGISFSSSRKDDRINKRYLRQTTLRIYQTAGPTIETKDLPYSRDEFPVPHLQTALEGVVPKSSVRPTFSNEFGYCVECRFKADRPKGIISPDEALEALGKAAQASLGEILVGDLEVDLDGAEPIAVILSVAATLLRRTLKRHDEIREQAKRQQAACRLADWIAQDAHEEAMKIVRFQQRFDALVAEFESEQDIQLAERLKKGGKLDMVTKAWNDTDEPWDQLSIEAARKFADRFKLSATPSGFPCSVSGGLKIKIHEVE